MKLSETVAIFVEVATIEITRMFILVLAIAAAVIGYDYAY